MATSIKEAQPVRVLALSRDTVWTNALQEALVPPQFQQPITVAHSIEEALYFTRLNLYELAAADNEGSTDPLRDVRLLFPLKNRFIDRSDPRSTGIQHMVLVSGQPLAREARLALRSIEGEPLADDYLIKVTNPDRIQSDFRELWDIITTKQMHPSDYHAA